MIVLGNLLPSCLFRADRAQVNPVYSLFWVFLWANFHLLIQFPFFFLFSPSTGKLAQKNQQPLTYKQLLPNVSFLKVKLCLEDVSKHRSCYNGVSSVAPHSILICSQHFSLPRRCSSICHSYNFYIIILTVEKSSACELLALVGIITLSKIFLLDLPVECHHNNKYAHLT